jgi:molybdenum cofactor cytidylyltransferase
MRLSNMSSGINNFERVGLILLAAGGSSRMGSPKQLLMHGGRTLIRSAALAAIESGCRPVVVVIGAAAAHTRSELDDIEVDPVENPQWESGLGSSIVCGINRLVATSPDADGAVVMLCDQPRVGADHIRALLLAARAVRADIAASEYGEGLGVPAVFSRSLFDELAHIPADRGAKRLIAGHRGPVARVPCPEAAADIDTPEDYRGILGSKL